MSTLMRQFTGRDWKFGKPGIRPGCRLGKGHRICGRDKETLLWHGRRSHGGLYCWDQLSDTWSTWPTKGVLRSVPRPEKRLQDDQAGIVERVIDLMKRIICRIVVKIWNLALAQPFSHQTLPSLIPTQTPFSMSGVGPVRSQP